MTCSNHHRFLILGLSAVLLVSAANNVMAKDLGAIGPVYPIKEKHMLDEIQDKLKVMEENGELDKLNKKRAKITKEKFLRPNPVKGLTKTTERRTFYYDPTYVLQQDIHDGEGQLIFKKGTTVNPLDMVNLTRYLIFFDGDDKEQIEWAMAVEKYYNGRVKMILTNGPVAQLSKDLEKPVFFDQQGMLVAKFGIKHVPAIVSQEEKLLRIDEVLAR